MDYSMSFGEGSRIGDKFEIVRKLGEGSLGDDIYKGKQLDLKRDVTIRILPRDVSQDKEMVQRFIQEIELTAALQHPNILPAYEAGEHMSRAYLVTAFEPGASLKQKLKIHGKFDWKPAMEIILALAEALEYAWDKEKVLHRNVRPDSILLSSGDKPLLADFGMAKSLSEQSMDLTMAGFTIGNPEYMSPEQVRGEADLDCRADIYCLGLVAYELLTGKPVISGSSQVALMQAQLKDVQRPACFVVDSVSQDCAAVVDKMLMKAKDDRYPDWTALIKDLKALLAGESVSAPAPVDPGEDLEVATKVMPNVKKPEPQKAPVTPPPAPEPEAAEETQPEPPAMTELPKKDKTTAIFITIIAILLGLGAVAIAAIIVLALIS